MTRTTLDLDASVLEQLREQARAEHKSMGALASEHLAAALREESMSRRQPLSLPAEHMGKSKVDLTDKEALRRILDGETTAGLQPGARSAP